jgi:transcriptional regulator with XRE-family HTH domain
LNRPSSSAKVEVSSISSHLRDRLANAQKAGGLTSAQLAAALRITPEWLSKILNGHVSGSEDIGLRLDDYLRRRGVAPPSTLEHEGTSTAAPAETHDDPPFTSAIAEALRADFTAILEAAGNNRDRLGWVRVQLDQMSAVSRSWLTLEEVNRRATERAKELTAAAQERRRLLDADHARRSRQSA